MYNKLFIINLVEIASTGRVYVFLVVVDLFNYCLFVLILMNLLLFPTGFPDFLFFSQRLINLVKKEFHQTFFAKVSLHNKVKFSIKDFFGKCDQKLI